MSSRDNATATHFHFPKQKTKKEIISTRQSKTSSMQLVKCKFGCIQNYNYIILRWVYKKTMMTLKWRQTSSGRQTEEMQLREATTAACFCLVLIWCTWFTQSVKAASVGRPVPNAYAPQRHLNTRVDEVRSAASYRQADYDYDEEENEEEEVEEELEAALSGVTNIGGGNVEAGEGNNGDDDDEEEEEDYEEDDEDNGGEEGRAVKRKLLIEKFMGIKM